MLPNRMQHDLDVKLLVLHNALPWFDAMDNYHHIVFLRETVPWLDVMDNYHLINSLHNAVPGLDAIINRHLINALSVGRLSQILQTVSVRVSAVLAP